MSLITPGDLRLRDVDLTPEVISDAGLQAIIDENEGEIIRRFGDHARAVEVLTGREFLFPARRVGSVISISEERSGVALALVPADYQVLDEGRSLRRLVIGATNPASTWGVSTVEYVPFDDVQSRVGALVALCQIDIRPAGVESRTMGRWSESYGSSQRSSREDQRTAILRRLAGFVVA